MCAASDRVLLSSSPSDFSEPTHVNVREPAAWAASFAERGFFRRTDVDLSFVTPWTVLFERANLLQRDVVYRYERYAYPMRIEVLEKRAALRDAHRELTEHGQDEVLELRHKLLEIRHKLLEIRHNLLTSRDHAIGAEAEAAQWRLRYETAVDELREARAELVATHKHLAETLDHLYTAYNSKTWRVGKAIVGPFSRLRRRHR